MRERTCVCVRARALRVRSTLSVHERDNRTDLNKSSCVLHKDHVCFWTKKKKKPVNSSHENVNKDMNSYFLQLYAYEYVWGGGESLYLTRYRSKKKKSFKKIEKLILISYNIFNYAKRFQLHTNSIRVVQILIAQTNSSNPQSSVRRVANVCVF